jgi:hypothetical protein
MVDKLMRCKVDGYRAFDHTDFTRHMATHWEEILVEVKQVPSRDSPTIESEPAATLDEPANVTVATGMNVLFGDESGSV